MSSTEKVTLTRDDLQGIVREAMVEHDKSSPRLTQNDVEGIVRRTVGEILVGLGVDHQNPVQIQQDFARLREWRLAVDAAKRKAMITLLGIAVTGLVATMWVGFKARMNIP